MAHWNAHKSFFSVEEKTPAAEVSGVVDHSHALTNISFFHLNVQCLANKIDELNIYLDKFSYHVVCLSEHWLQGGDINLVKLCGYVLGTSYSRTSHIHGGVGIYVREHIKFKNIELCKYCCEMHAEFCSIELLDFNCIVICIYRPCSGDFDVFLNALGNVLRSMTKLTKKIVLAGDFNVRFCGRSRDLMELLVLVESFGLKVTISDFTRVSSTSSTCIDNIITDFNGDLIETAVIDPCISDHYAQIMTVETNVPLVPTTSLRRIFTTSGVNKLKDSLKDSSFGSPIVCPENMAESFVRTYESLIKKYSSKKMESAKSSGELVH